MERRAQKLFVGVDEYDAPANSVLFDGDRDHYNRLAEFFKTQFFAIIKQATFSVVDKYWITGVLPVLRDGISPLNAVTLVSHLRGFHGLCGLNEKEVETIAQAYLSARRPQELKCAVDDLRRWYNGYLFCKDIDRRLPLDTLFNPQLVFLHLRGLANRDIQIKPIDEIYAIHTSRVLEAIPNQGRSSFLELYLRAQSRSLQSQIVPQFGAAEIQQLGSNVSVTHTLLYHLGVLTHAGDGKHLKIPNATMTNVVSRASTSKDWC